MHKYQTSVSFQGTRILVNGHPTYEGREKAEGLLFNLRMVNATFDDTLGKVSWWDDDGSRPENRHAGYGTWRSPESAIANTQRFIQALPEYKAWGILGNGDSLSQRPTKVLDSFKSLITGSYGLDNLQ